MPLIWVEPELYLEHQGVKIYRTYKNDNQNDPYQCYYTTDVTEDEPAFDIRDLSTFGVLREYGDIIRSAIEIGEIKMPEGDIEAAKANLHAEWYAIEGYGFTFSAVKDFIDPNKICGQLVANGENSLAEGQSAYNAFMELDDDGRWDFILDYARDYDNELFGVIVTADEKMLALSSTSDISGEYYLLLIPYYPWSGPDNVPRSEEEAKQHLCQLLGRFTLPCVTNEELVAKMEYIHKLCCG